MDYENEIIRTINEISGSRSPYEVFCDWIKCMAIAISNNQTFFRDKIWQEREQLYIDTIKKYSEEEKNNFVKMRELLVSEMENHMGDILGEIFMKSDMGSKINGQFFTPYAVNQATARTLIKQTKPDKNGVYHLYEPTCGAGGMIIAMAQCLKEEGIDYQKKLKVVAQDLDWKSVYMAYVQLSYYGIRAKIIQGDAIENGTQCEAMKERIFITPMEMWRI